MALNDLAATGAAIEVTFYDTDFDEEDEPEGEDAPAEARDDDQRSLLALSDRLRDEAQPGSSTEELGA